MSTKNIIAISYAKRTLEKGSREYQRMQSYAQLLDSYHVIVFTRQKEGFPEMQRDGTLYTYAANARTRVGMLWRAYRIGRQIVKKQPADQFIVSSQDPFETSLVGRAIARANNVTHHVQIHGDVFNPASYRTTLLQRLRVVYGRYVVRHATKVRVVSNRIKRSIVQLGVNDSLISVLPVQADLSSLLEIGEKRIYTQHTPLRLLFLGRLAPEKQIDMLLDACVILQSKQIEFRLDIVGSGPQETHVWQRVKKLRLEHDVHFTSWTNDIASVLQKADVFCLPSAHEGWGMVLLEAAAAGLAVVSTNVGCVGEVFEDELNALIANSALEFADNIIRLTDVTVRSRLAQRGYQAALQFTSTNTNYTERLVAEHF